MLFALVLIFYAIAAMVTLGTLWIALYRPWAFRPRVPVPDELPMLVWITPEQDNPIPWI